MRKMHVGLPARRDPIRKYTNRLILEKAPAGWLSTEARWKELAGDEIQPGCITG